MVIVSSYKTVGYFGVDIVVPQTANFVAMDGDNRLFAYREKPVLNRNPFEPYDLVYVGEGIYVGYVSNPKMSVQESLVQI